MGEIPIMHSLRDGFNIVNYNILGKTGLKVSEIGLGTAQIGGPSIISGKPFGAKAISDDDAFEILRIATEGGVNFFDSSDKYGDGLAEKRLGIFFKGTPEVIIATKCGFDENAKRRFDRGYVIKTVDEALMRLKRDYIDIYQFSKPTLKDIEREDIIGTVEILKRDGKIRFAGISVGEIADGFGFIEQGVWDSFQVIYNLLTLDFKDFISEAAKSGCGTIIRSPLSSGMLTGRFGENTKFPDTDDRSVFMKGELLQFRSKIVESIKERFDLTNENLILFSLNFLLSAPDVDTVIPGANSPAQMMNNLKVLNMPRFSSMQWNEIFNFCQKLLFSSPIHVSY